MKKAWLKKITKIVDELDELINTMQIEQESIEDKAYNKGRDMTDHEQTRYDEIDDCITGVQNAIDYLHEYTLLED